jgi:hypothetical protein
VLACEVVQVLQRVCYKQCLGGPCTYVLASRCTTAAPRLPSLVYSPVSDFVKGTRRCNKPGWRSLSTGHGRFARTQCHHKCLVMHRLLAEQDAPGPNLKQAIISRGHICRPGNNRCLLSRAHRSTWLASQRGCCDEQPACSKGVLDLLAHKSACVACCSGSACYQLLIVLACRLLVLLTRCCPL